MMRHKASFWTEERSLSVFLALLVIQIFVIHPLSLGDRLMLTVMNAVSGALFLLSGMLAVTQHGVMRWLAAGFIAAVIGVHVVSQTTPARGLIVADSMLTFLAIACFLAVVLRNVYKPGPVSAHRVRGAVAAYLLIGYFFMALYRLINYLFPDAFAAHTALVQPGENISNVFMYFSLVTLTTVGFGDVTAVHPAARSLVMLEGVVGTLYPTIFIARLVSLQLEQERR
jgi:hypothetical protein